MERQNRHNGPALAWFGVPLLKRSSPDRLGLRPGSVRLRSRALDLRFSGALAAGLIPRPPPGLSPCARSRGRAPPPSTATLNCARLRFCWILRRREHQKSFSRVRSNLTGGVGRWYVPHGVRDQRLPQAGVLVNSTIPSHDTTTSYYRQYTFDISCSLLLHASVAVHMLPGTSLLQY